MAMRIAPPPVSLVYRSPSATKKQQQQHGQPAASSTPRRRDSGVYGFGSPLTDEAAGVLSELESEFGFNGLDSDDEDTERSPESWDKNEYNGFDDLDDEKSTSPSKKPVYGSPSSYKSSFKNKTPTNDMNGSDIGVEFEDYELDDDTEEQSNTKSSKAAEASNRSNWWSEEQKFKHRDNSDTTSQDSGNVADFNSPSSPPGGSDKRNSNFRNKNDDGNSTQSINHSYDHHNNSRNAIFRKKRNDQEQMKAQREREMRLQKEAERQQKEQQAWAARRKASMEAERVEQEERTKRLEQDSTSQLKKNNGSIHNNANTALKSPTTYSNNNNNNNTNGDNNDNDDGFDDTSVHNIDSGIVPQHISSNVSSPSTVFALKGSPSIARTQSAHVSGSPKVTRHPMSSSPKMSRNPMHSNSSLASQFSQSPMASSKFGVNHADVTDGTKPKVDFGLLARTMSSLREPTTPPAWGRPPSAPVSKMNSPRPSNVSNMSATSLNDNDDEYEDLDPAAIEAAKWTDSQIRKLISVIQQFGTKNESGQVQILFSVLFEETANIFDALSGICKTAKKYKVVAFNPEQLWQGQHDNEIITLLKDTHDGIEIKKRRKLSAMGRSSSSSRIQGFSNESKGFGQSKCHVCSKTVYPMEFIGASDKAFHKNCFRCFKCKKKLSQNDYFVGQDNAFRCAAHHREYEMSQM